MNLIISYQFEKIKHITVSFGVTEILSDQDTLESLLSRVNKALEEAQKKEIVSYQYNKNI